MHCNENDPTVLEAGMCFHLIPDLKLVHQGGVVFSESVLVTETGHERLPCGIALRAERLKDRLPVALDVTSLILIQHAPLAIRFRADEKRFDVDGAYNVRYEIIKKRIDKAIVRGTTERLTQPGKIALVYSHSSEAEEWREYIEHLQRRRYLTGDVEELELDELRGAQGLRALRVAVDLANPELGVPSTLAGLVPSGEDTPAAYSHPGCVDTLTRLRGAGYALGILSNVDDDLLAGTLRHLDVRFSLLVTAQQVRSYKPALGHFTTARERIGAQRWLHAAQSYFHDVTPAVTQHIPVAWINRKGEQPTGAARPDREFRTLAALADWLVNES